MPIKGATYRYKKGTDIRLAFDQKGNVIEAVNTKTGATHSPAEFKADAKARSTRMAQAPTPTKKPVVKTQASRKASRAEQAAEATADQELTPLGKRTLAGFIKKWGEEDGEKRFQDALNSGVLDPDKMVKEPADEPADEDETDEFTGGPPMPMPKKKKMMVMPAGMMGGM